MDTGVLQNENRYKLEFFDYRNAISPVYDIAGAQKTDQDYSVAHSYLGITQYASLIKTSDQGGLSSYPRATKLSRSSTAHDNAINT